MLLASGVESVGPGMPPPFFYWSFGPQICNDSVLLVQLRLSDLFLVRRPAHKSPRTVQAVAAARPAICRANKLNAVSYSGSSPGAVTSHVVDTTTVNSPDREGDQENQRNCLERLVDGKRHIVVEGAGGSEYETQEYQQ